ncbi:MAG TPA: guanosine monophosphate reductase [Candidatus Cloacimonetes bacterium]|nr:guanosine monophosphate reductase [Candidatus Cloacimonadota bacterium]HEX38349.1 guanosine monophosphate reductase [Candidatus Cloacimonadota bacterium]
MAKIGLTFDDILLIPNYSEILSRMDVDLSSQVTKNFRLKLPIISANMDTITEFDMANTMSGYGALGIIHRFCSVDEEADIIQRLMLAENPLRAASIGVTGNNKARLKAVVDAGAQIICIDIAHGHHKLMAETIEMCKKFNVDVIAGNIATKEAAKFLCDCGADAIKVGIGPGSMCTTRINTGFGVPQVTAIEEVTEVAKKYNIPIIADGGIQNSGDVAKALAIGADTVMIGALFAGCKETPGTIHKEGNFPNYRLYKRYRGSASLESKQVRGDEKRNVEGISSTIDYKGPAKYVIQNIEDGLRSAFSYAGAKNIDEYHKKVKYIQKFRKDIRTV